MTHNAILNRNSFQFQESNIMHNDQLKNKNKQTNKHKFS